MTALFQVDIATAEFLEESDGRTEIDGAVLTGGFYWTLHQMN